jgi:mannose-1-phosphate guanylyltransferase/mannose-6-phosphate isomerase
MLRDTASRFDGETGFADAAVICNKTYAETIATDFESGKLQLAAIVAEPGRRDTAAAAALAAFYVRDTDRDGYVLLLPSDHHIRRPAEFAAAIRNAAETANDVINTFGVVPERPDTGFGYIKRDEIADALGALHRVEAFVEKPDAATAQAYIDSGCYYWNAGIFLFRPDTFLSELARFQPGIHSAVERAWSERREATISGTAVHMPSDTFFESASISLDYAVMEKTDAATVMPVNIGWDDLGSWSALRNLHGPDSKGNVVSGDAHLFDSENTYIESRSRLVVALGVTDIIVVDTEDALLVCGGGASQGVKAVHSKLVELGRAEAEYHPDTTSRRVALREWYRKWLLEDALPLWVSEAAIDTETGLPQESLGYDAAPMEDTVRTRVLSRQIFTFAFAADQLGWDLSRARALIAYLTETYMNSVRAGIGSVARLTRDGTIVDHKWDTYDQAFHILAMAWAYRATGKERYAVLGEAALHELNNSLKHANIGYREDSDGSSPRRANPHMHLLEAALSWMRTEKRAMFAPLAEETVSVFHDSFCRGGLLFERFDESLSTVDDPTSDDAVEPGHLYEWATLVKLAGADGIRQDETGRTAAMVGFADAYGRSSKTGLVFDTSSADGIRNSGTHRLWPQTEMVRHHLLYGTPAQTKAALDLLEDIRRLYLNPGVVKGLWRDSLTEDLKDRGDRAPASTLYHLINMIAVI